ncbi:DNA repair protein RadA [Alteromonas mediterranea]|jgi:DNA repair protein RadA/Sms|uniref:DNA repair protein RadA n=2 Tax=Alteromonas mediterranea TaxID=314275 RepID=A0AAC8XKQ1_9ALTE|nr:DNA repair protein RadA [Alteromonas mediterranea]AEA98632.1 DNA repair protein RadA [Alteromonas mediterranea DE]AFV86175.1 DNA repair protein RadA [Alteromonas mediterranea DE1]AGP98187.1 DNA repair protein RadA [Alteromonas mediterranea UM7]AGQ02445.1 DNA repair protein RadA [Alteromonas mediterranea UM4b]AMJ79185.1 DNA repair protein RadA [Alteromonas mediterranea]|tara:strand:- start:922 stop:2289 length:1368 start_codon:yes stop_codon:yes gene_type:complete
MAKRKTAYVCSDCGAEFPRWQGQCSECKAWNTISEFVVASAKSATRQTTSGYAGQTAAKIETLNAIDLESLPRFSSTFKELDRVLGGGIVPGAAMLIGGSPGAGKSTLLLQVMCQMAKSESALYVTGEESLQQVAMRAKRLSLPDDKLMMLAETNVETICDLALTQKPKIMVIDSIQVMHVSDVQSAPGSVSQVRESAAYLTRFAKQNHIAMFIVGHVTKDGNLAGPKVLEHCIDSSMMLEGESDGRYRTLRSHKNRFGAVNELGVFAMTEKGLKEVSNPSAIFLSRGDNDTPGSSVMVIWEGTRPLLVEIQALVDYSQMSNPRRIAVGLDQNRLSMLLAVLHRHGNVQMNDQDVFVNVVGGVRVSETSADLALLLAMISSFRNRSLPRDLIVFGEVGLAGEIRPVPNGTERIIEAAKHGFKRAVVPKANAPKQAINGMKVVPVARLSEALDALE